MSDDSKQTDSEQLFDTDQSEGGADAAEDTGGKEKPLAKGEKKQDLQLDEQVKPTAKAAEQRQKQIDAWTQKVLMGEADIDNLPQDIKWLKPFINEKIGALEKTPEIEQLVEKKLAEKDDKRLFESLRQSLNQVDLSLSQRQEIESEYKDLQGFMSPGKALQKAIKIANVILDNEAANKAELKEAMALPKGTHRAERPVTEANFMQLPEKERLKLYKDMEAGRV